MLNYLLFPELSNETLKIPSWKQERGKENNTYFAYVLCKHQGSFSFQGLSEAHLASTILITIELLWTICFINSTNAYGKSPYSSLLQKIFCHLYFQIIPLRKFSFRTTQSMRKNASSCKTREHSISITFTLNGGAKSLDPPFG